MSSPVATRLAPPAPELDVHGVVLAVAAPQAEEHRGPAPQPDPLLLERAREVQLVRAHLVVGCPPPAARR